MDEFYAELEGGINLIGSEIDGVLAGVMGIQPTGNVDLIRHAYVLPAYLGRGVGSAFIAHLLGRAERRVLIGAWAAASWAVGIYQRHGFELVSDSERAALLRTYWTVPERQIEASVMLAAPVLSSDEATELMRANGRTG